MGRHTIRLLAIGAVSALALSACADSADSKDEGSPSGSAEKGPIVIGAAVDRLLCGG